MIREARVGESAALPGFRSGSPRVMLHAALFVLGFTVVFSFLGASVGLVGYVLQDARRWINVAAGALLVVFGLHVTGLLRLVTVGLVRAEASGDLPRALRPVSAGMLKLTETLYREKRIEFQPRGRGPFASFGVGMVFAVGWTPCVGFVLGGILSAAFNAGEATTSLLLLLAYSLGLGVPFLLVAGFIDRSRGLLRVLARRSTSVGVVSGVALVVFGLFIAFDVTARLSAMLGRVPVVSDAFLAEGLEASLGVGWTVPAFIAGVLSFLSPCVLPMVPIYLAHLAGAGVAQPEPA